MLIGTTTGYHHEIWLDVPVTGACQPAFWHSQTLEQCFDKTKSTNINFSRDLGWSLNSHFELAFNIHEMTVSDDSFISFNFAPDTTAGSGMLSKNTQWTPNLPWLGVTSTRSSGDAMARKSYVSGDTNAINHATDQASFPRPGYSSPVSMDRLAVSTDTFTPLDHISIRFSLPHAPSNKTNGPVIGFTFCSIPGNAVGDSAVGTGQYYLLLQGDGASYLYELLADNTWQIRFTAVWAIASQVAGMSHFIRIASDAYDDGAGNYYGSRIHLSFYTGNDIFASSANQVTTVEPTPYVYQVPQLTVNQPTPTNVRIDIRRDVDLHFNSTVRKYESSGTFISNVFRMPYEPSNAHGGNPIKITLNGSFPSGQSTTLKLYGSFDGKTGWTACSTAGSLNTASTYVEQDFNIATGTISGNTRGFQYYYVEADSTSSGTRRRSPLINSLTAVRDAVVITTAPTPVKVPQIANMSITGQSADPSTETFSALIIDQTATVASILDNRANIPFYVKTFYDPNDATKFTISFRGRIIKAVKTLHTQVVTDNGGNQVNLAYGYYQLVGVGEWYRLMNAKAKKNWNFATGGNGPNGVWLASDVINALLLSEGYLATQIDCPTISDAPLLVSTDKTTPFILEPYSPIGPLLVHIAREYLGAYLVFDENATNGGSAGDVLGCWRVVRPPKPNGSGKYRALAAWSSGDPQAGHNAIYYDAYATVNDGLGGTIRPKFIRKYKNGVSSLNTWVQGAEGTHAVVTGVGVAAGSLLSKGSQQLSIDVYNWKAADFGQTGSDGHPVVDPTSPDYSDGIPVDLYLCSQALTTPDAVRWAARRVYDYSMHSRKWARFESAWTLVTNPDDSLQIRPRRPRYGDIALLDGAVRVVNAGTFQTSMSELECNSSASYEVFAVPALQTGTSTDQLYRSILGFWE